MDVNSDSRFIRLKRKPATSYIELSTANVRMPIIVSEKQPLVTTHI